MHFQFLGTRVRYLSHVAWSLVLLGILVAGVIKVLPPREHARLALTQTPWMTVEVVKDQGSPVPFGNLEAPELLYLIFVHGDGRALRVNLQTRETRQIESREEGQQAAKIAQYDLGGPHLLNVTPLKWRFQGTVEPRDVYHLFGFPWPNAPMTRRAHLRQGDWCLMDVRNGIPTEVLRFGVRNSERRENDLGDLFISLDGRWIVFMDRDAPSRVHVFRRDPPVQPSALGSPAGASS